MNKTEYAEKLHALETCAPNHPLLLVLRRGYSKINEVYLKNALKEVDAAPVIDTDSTDSYQNEGFEADNEDFIPDDVNDKTLRMMRVELRKLFADRAKLSDRFHELKTQAERAENSEEIQIIQRSIGRQMQKIRTYKITGQLPPDENVAFYVPKDGLALANQLCSLRVRISRKNSYIKELRQKAGENNALERKLEKELDKLAKLKGELAQVLAAIEALKKSS